MWIDTHCHLDASEFDRDRAQVLARAQQAGITQIVIPAVRAQDFARVRALAHEHGLAYALGIHPLFTQRAHPDDLAQLEQHLHASRDDPHLVAVGEIGLDATVPGLNWDQQMFFYTQQLRIAREFDLPVILHVRKSADFLLKGLRMTQVRGGVAHAFNGSEQQAQAFLDRGFVLGFGGAMTFERALNIRRLAGRLPESAIVLETDAPDMPPHWLYRTAIEREAQGPARNEPSELVRMAQTLAQLRALSPADVAAFSARNAHAALPKLACLGAMKLSHAATLGTDGAVS